MIAVAPCVVGRPESISIDGPIAAKKLVGQLGRIDRTKTAVSALAKLS